jgi:ABC-2 type transport system permease protein
MPDDLREIALKDLRAFLRDPMQWSQQLILMGLLGIYVLNIRDVPVKIDAYGMQLAISFLNLAAVSLLLATFTSRFVFPMITLELQQLWLVGMLPMPRGRILLPKFCFALTVTFMAGAAVTLLASRVGRASLELVLINLIVVAAVCIGLCGLAVGLGGRFPMIGERNPAKIASGVGGTLNLAVSVTVVAALLAGCFVIGRRFYRMGEVFIDAPTVVLLAVVVAGGVGACVAAMNWGQRHFERLEC